MIQFIPFDPTDPDTVVQTVGEIDLILNYYENADFMDEDVDLNGDRDVEQNDE